MNRQGSATVLPRAPTSSLTEAAAGFIARGMTDNSEHISGPQQGIPDAAALAALMDPVALEARLAEARARRVRALASGAAASGGRSEETPVVEAELTPSVHARVSRFTPNGFVAGLALGAALAAAAIAPFLGSHAFRPAAETTIVQTGGKTSHPATLPVALPAVARASLPAPGQAFLALALRPEPRPADLRPATPTRQLSARNTPVRSSRPPQPALLAAVVQQGRALGITADAGIRDATRTVDRLVVDLGKALPKPARKALRAAARNSTLEPRKPGRPRRD